MITMLSFLKRMTDTNQIELRKIHKILPRINEYYNKFQALSAQELQDKSYELYWEIKKGNKCRGNKYIAFALVKEAVNRVLGFRMHDTQLVGGWVLADGKIAEMATGEGKTVVSLLPAYWFALQGNGVHVITTNTYLATRDFEEMGRVYEFLGLSIGLNHSDLNIQQKQEVYQKDITYGVWNEFGFDYLKDQLVLQKEQQVQRKHAYAVVDEIDSVLIDEARTPMIIAGKTKAAPDLYHVCARFVQGLKEDIDYEVDRETKQVMFTDKGIRKTEATFLIDNIYEIENTTVYHYLLQSLRAKIMLKRDVDYIVSDDQVQLIDAFTGRIMEGRQLSEGLHQAIEAKEKVPLSEETRPHAMITVQKYFNLYEQLAGMSGTIKTNEEEIRKIYGVDVISIPTNKPIARKDYKDLIFQTKFEKYNAAVSEIIERNKSGQPVLVGTTSVRQSEEVAKRLRVEMVPFQLLNAKTEREEAEIISGAGQKGAVTIATNMAGRGTDIKLGEGVAELGGLHVIGTERHESRRIDNQLRGRAGRQGDPGLSQFYVSLEDELVERFAYDEAKPFKEQDIGRSQLIELRAFFENVQYRVEQQMFSMRSMVYQLDSVVHSQRETFYQHRNDVLQDRLSIDELLYKHVLAHLSEITEMDFVDGEWNAERLQKDLPKLFFESIDWSEIANQKDLNEVLEIWWKSQWKKFSDITLLNFDKNNWKTWYLKLIDSTWLDHLEQLNQLKQGIHYRFYANKDIVQAYQEDAWCLYGAMETKIQSNIAKQILTEIEKQDTSIQDMTG